MDIRYKIYKQYDLGVFTSYCIEIQIYKPNRLFKHWKHFAYTSVQDLCLRYYSNTAIETMEKFINNNNITEVIVEFVKDSLKTQKNKDEEDIRIAEFENKILTKHWTRINIKR